METVPFCMMMVTHASKREAQQGEYSVLRDFVPRLRAVRKEMGLTQAQFAVKAGVGLGAQNRYESGATEPSATYFANLAMVGVDVVYLLTGERSAGLIAPEAAAILDATSRLKDDQRAALLAFLATV